jgi:hypothetical protein
LKIVETLLPIGADMWSAVEASFSKQTVRKDVPREADSLKKKFQTLQQAKKPTGATDLPFEVSEARRIYKKVLDKCHAGERGNRLGERTGWTT